MVTVLAVMFWLTFEFRNLSVPRGGGAEFALKVNG
jgi:hypothetical protein